MYNRQITQRVINSLENKQIAIIYGTRQVGKTTLTQEIVDYFIEVKNYKPDDIMQISGDLLLTRQIMSSQSKDLLTYVGDKKLLIVDEAQRIENIGVNLKIIYDNLPDLKIIATGSSSFELANKINEPLTGRNNKYLLTPLSFNELTQKENPIELKNSLNKFLIYGTYPKIYLQNSFEQKVQNLTDLSSDYLYKDILQWENIQKSDKLSKILEYLSLQIGGTVSFHDIGLKLELDKQTVEKYIDLLEKAFVIFRLRAYSRNKGTELTRSFKIYFWDLGIRNSLIRNFNNLDVRGDIGAMWENYCVSERIKKNQNLGVNANYYFWRNYAQNEVDFVEDRDGKLFGYEFKYDKNKMQKGSYNFIKNYPETTLELVNKSNFIEFLE
jgi:uncharacterized protein